MNEEITMAGLDFEEIQTEDQIGYDADFNNFLTGGGTVSLVTIHYDLMLIVFLMLVFWCYRQVKNGLRQMNKFTKK